MQIDNKKYIVLNLETARKENTSQKNQTRHKQQNNSINIGTINHLKQSRHTVVTKTDQGNVNGNQKYIKINKKYSEKYDE